MNYSFISCTGAATCGKDTLVSIFKRIFPDIYIDQRAFATELKLELDPITKLNFGISAFTKDSSEKTLIRPLMVSWAHIRRTQSRGQYFWKKIEPHVLESLKENNLVMISDFRFIQEYEQDEDFFIRKNNGVIIHVTRYNKDGSIVAPANDTEAKFEEKLIKAADYRVCWPTSDNMDSLEDFVRTQLSDLILKIKDKHGIKE